jgi:hypothetical protein
MGNLFFSILYRIVQKHLRMTSVTSEKQRESLFLGLFSIYPNGGGYLSI